VKLLGGYSALRRRRSMSEEKRRKTEKRENPGK
jgi:hypothetical protein